MFFTWKVKNVKVTFEYDLGRFKPQNNNDAR